MKLIHLTILFFAFSTNAKTEHFCKDSKAFEVLLIKDASPLSCDQVKSIDVVSHEVFTLSPIEIDNPSLVLNGEKLAKAENTGAGVHIGLNSNFKDSKTQQAILVHELGHTIFHNYFYKAFPETEEFIELENKIRKSVGKITPLQEDGECKSKQCKRVLAKLSTLENRRDKLEEDTKGIRDFMLEFVRPYNELIADAVAVLHFEDPEVMQHTLKGAKPKRESPHADCRSFIEIDQNHPLTDHCAFSSLRSKILKDILLPGIKSGQKKEALETLLKLVTHEITKQYQKILEDYPKGSLNEEHETLINRKYVEELKSLLIALRHHSASESGMPVEERDSGKEVTNLQTGRPPSRSRTSSN